MIKIWQVKMVSFRRDFPSGLAGLTGCYLGPLDYPRLVIARKRISSFSSKPQLCLMIFHFLGQNLKAPGIIDMIVVVGGWDAF